MSAVQQSQEGIPAPNSSEAGDNATPTTTGNDGASTSESGNVDKIRDILFGGQMRDYDKRFARLEERLIRESVELREDNRRRVEALETFVNNELAALTNRLLSEQQSREISLQTMSRELNEAIKALDARFTQFYNQSTDTQHDLRKQILEQSKSLQEEIYRKHEDVSAALTREVADINHQKTDRASLSSLFTELAMRLNNDFKIPNGN